MKRTLMAVVIGFVLAVLIALFQFTDIPSLIAALDTGLIQNPMMQAALIFEMLLRPYTLAIASIYLPLVALGVAGIVSGLISKSRAKMLPVSVIILILFFLGYFMLYMASGIMDFNSMLSELQTMAIDIGIAFFLLFILGIIGASITQEEN